jgi:hypothetical protein
MQLKEIKWSLYWEIFFKDFNPGAGEIGDPTIQIY